MDFRASSRLLREIFPNKAASTARTRLAETALMRALLLCVLATGLVRGAPLGQRSLDATLALIERDVAALEKMDAASRCDDLCTVGKHWHYSWAQKCEWVECKGCKDCTPEGIAEDSRRHNERTELRRRIGNKELHKEGDTDEDLAAAGFHYVPQCSSYNKDQARCELAFTRITKWHLTRRWETRREPGEYLCHYHFGIITGGPPICSMHTEDEVKSKRWF